ncbi:MAG: glutamate--tRNA ligase [Solobacterium sp.]|jgi:nondiscriminating glutamyl-tRNA synthetase|nr:glutamate--tRNA ligase [Solobacterium sp.]MCH4049981.1 glutamate--tRNA ligase [Solobacterium sp.]MCH4073666.1 glutamate--tRNA ligase [Solobacterium sp.]MCI1313155.1 glutamate--tRNA ligase [Solobacterium sp.]MCI1346735.1 glutamate--tRNA ligase [Solobacterium sp.]
MAIRTRFAPSPTGYMHIGNLRTALYAYLVAKKDPDGVFILRIEDTDQGRLVEGATDIIYETLKQCGLKHDEGPDVGGPVGPYVQSDRVKSGLYMKYAKELIAKGGAHYCFCDEDMINAQRELQEARGESFKYDDPCKKLSIEECENRIANGEKFVIRQTIPETGTTSFEDEVFGKITVDNETLDEQILIKSDGFPTYNFANVVDDHLMGITDVVRGMEYLSSTPKYNLIYDAFGWDIPRYIHCPPVMKDEHHKLSKRNGDASFQDLVAKGYLPGAILNYIALLGWSPEEDKEIFTLDELVKAFNVKHIGKMGAIFDPEKLKWINGMWLRNMDLDSYYNLVKPYIDEAVKGDFDGKKIAAILQQRAQTLNEIPGMLDFFDTFPSYDNSLYVNKKMKTDEAVSLESLKACYELLESIDEADWNQENLHTQLLALPKKMGRKNGQVLFPLRLAITGKQFTPGGAIEIADILGKKETLRRLDLSIKQLEK